MIELNSITANGSNKKINESRIVESQFKELFRQFVLSREFVGENSFID